MKIAIIGYGNSGMALIGELSKNHDVSIITNQQDLPEQVIYHDICSKESTIHDVTRTDYSSLKDFDVIWVTTPVNQHIYPVLDKLSKTLEDQLVIFSPGQGGLDSLLDKYKINSKNVVTLLPMPFNCRKFSQDIVRIHTLKKNFVWFGEEKNSSKLKDVLKFSNRLIRGGDIRDTDLISINPILHSSRLYCELERRGWNNKFDVKEEFYEFGDAEIRLIDYMSKEVSQICENDNLKELLDLNFFLKDFVYEDFEKTVKDFYNYHPAYRDISFPIKDGKLDVKSRYFTEDLEGLRILRDRIISAGYVCSTIDIVLRTLEKFVNDEELQYGI